MINLELANRTTGKINHHLIKTITDNFALAIHLKHPASLSLVFVDRRAIRKWNLIYRGKDKATDVLSFAQRDAEQIPGESDDLGEILICLGVAKDQAKQYGWSLDREIARLLIHGLAHLAGYEHEGVSAKEADRMIKFENRLAAKIFMD